MSTTQPIPAKNIKWKVEGMHCANCALSISQYLQKIGMEEVRVNAITGDIQFHNRTKQFTEDYLQNGIEQLGYTVIKDPSINHISTQKKKTVNTYLLYFFCSLPFTLLLSLHMLHQWIQWHWLMNPWLQLLLCLPVFAMGMWHFGRSAWRSLLRGVANMNVLIALGGLAAFAYSLTGTLLQLGDSYLFYETTATIFTLVFLGNYVESVAVNTTQRALNKLSQHQQVMAHMIAFDDKHQELIFPVANTTLKVGDLILIKSGEQVPADCKILWGNASINESIITGESLPVTKNPKDHLLNGSLLVDGAIKAQVTAAADQSVLATIINWVKQAQADKPPAQLLADKISAVFVPVVLAIALLTFVINYLVLHEFTPALMRSVAVLVIACPCAMGLATPAAVAVGLGRAARHGILFRNAKSLETFKHIKQIVFDKTGTLTTGLFTLTQFKILDPSIPEATFKQIAFSLEKYSNHPIATCIAKTWKTTPEQPWQKIEEIKGWGMKATTTLGDTFIAGSFAAAQALTSDNHHAVYLIKNNILLGWIDVQDTLRPEAPSIIQYLINKGIKPILLSGDRLATCQIIAQQVGITEIIAEQTPLQKLQLVEKYSKTISTAMVGDGINDAPALAKATIGIAVNGASAIAVDAANVILMNNGLTSLPLALGLGKHTLITIQQNLFWAFAYNVIAIPIAAVGGLTPALAALAMGCSDLVLAFNAIRLYVKKVV
jgi:P-type Cu+ transporter